MSKHKELLEKLFMEKYWDEFEVIDKLNQHPEGLNFKEWMMARHNIDLDDY